jgi:Flp pilus assembly protein TadG
MMKMFRNLRRDRRGSAAIETAIVAPVLILMSLGGFQVSQVVARQHELNYGADEATAMVLAGWTDSTEQRTALTSVVQASLGLSADKITISAKFRCGTDTAYVDNKDSCASGTTVASFLRIQITDQYAPVWTRFGIGSAINFSVNRMVQVS